MSGQKGARYERELRDFFHDQGGAAMRAPASGARTDKELPDILGKINDQLWACELKYTSKEKARFSKEEINELLFFSSKWDAQPALVARFSYDRTFWAYPFKDMRSFKRWKDYKTVFFSREECGDTLQDLGELIEREIEPDDPINRLDGREL